jgi:hypothetical protein
MKRMARAWHRIKRARKYEKEDYRMFWDKQTYERVKVRVPKVTGEVGDKNYGMPLLEKPEKKSSRVPVQSKFSLGRVTSKHLIFDILSYTST